MKISKILAAAALAVLLSACGGGDPSLPTQTPIAEVPTPAVVTDVTMKTSGTPAAVQVLPGQQGVVLASFVREDKAEFSRRLVSELVFTNSADGSFYDSLDTSSLKVLDSNGQDVSISSPYGVEIRDGGRTLAVWFFYGWYGNFPLPSSTGPQPIVSYTLQATAKPTASTSVIKLALSTVWMDNANATGSSTAVGGTVTIAPQADLIPPTVLVVSRLNYDSTVAGNYMTPVVMQISCDAKNKAPCVLQGMKEQIFGGGNALITAGAFIPLMQIDNYQRMVTNIGFVIPQGETRQVTIVVQALGTGLSASVPEMTFDVGGVKMTPNIGCSDSGPPPTPGVIFIGSCKG
jgi:hypothetical protein